MRPRFRHQFAARAALIADDFRCALARSIDLELRKAFDRMVSAVTDTEYMRAIIPNDPEALRRSCDRQFSEIRASLGRKLNSASVAEIGEALLAGAVFAAVLEELPEPATEPAPAAPSSTEGGPL